MPPLTCPELHELYQKTQRNIGVFEKLCEEMILHPEKFDELVGVYNEVMKGTFKLTRNRDEKKEKAWVQEVMGAEEVGEKDINGWWGVEVGDGKWTWYHPEKGEKYGEVFEYIYVPDSNGWWGVQVDEYDEWTWYNPERRERRSEWFELINRVGSDGWWEIRVDEEWKQFNPSTGVLKNY